MKANIKRKTALSILLSFCMVLSCISTTAFAATAEDGLCGHHTEHSQEVCGYVEGVSACAYDCRVCSVQALIDALPGEVRLENAEVVAAQLTAIDSEKASLSDEELALVDFAKYTAAAEALGSVYAAVPAVETYAVSISSLTPGCTVTADKSSAAAGETVTLTVTPADGYKLEALTVEWEMGTVSVTEVEAGKTYTFVMPDFEAIVCATFVASDTDTDTGSGSISGYCGGEGDGTNLTWSFEEATGTLTISGTGAMAAFEEVPEGAESTEGGIPWRSYQSSIQSVIIESGVTTIGDRAFYNCKGLTGITIPDGVTAIGNSAFSNCDALASITIPAGVTTIGESAFHNCIALASVTIPGSVTTIGDDAFSYCEALASVTIPGSVTTIGNFAFRGCKSLASVTIPGSVTTIGESAFYDCIALTSVTIPNGVTTIDYKTFYGCKSLASVTIPAGVTTIDDAAFYGCESLASVTIPEGVTTIGRSAFYRCYALTSVTIPESVTTIGESAFYDCIALASVTIPAGVTAISDYAFHRCSALTSVTIPAGVTTIGNYAFYGCGTLTSVTIPAGVTTIGNYSFYGCGDLASVTIPAGVTTIGESAFESCAALASVTIPGSVTTIGKSAFYGCRALTSVTIPEGVTTIGDGAFSRCDALASVTIPGSVTSIGRNAFIYCTALASVTIPEGVTTIGDAAFQGCTALAGIITIPNSVTTIGESAFYYCGALTGVVVPDSVTSIGGYAFADIKCDVHFLGSSEKWTFSDALGQTEVHFCQVEAPAVPSTCNTAGTSVKWKCTSCDFTCGSETLPLDPDNHSFSPDGKCAYGCGTQAAAKIGDAFYTSLSAAAGAAVSGDTIQVLSDVTIGAEETVTFAEGVTLDANGYSITCSGAVKIGEKDGILFQNQLYYHGGGFDGMSMSRDIPATYWDAGEGYVIFVPGSEGDGHTLTLHNAVAQLVLYSSAEGGIWSGENLTVNFSGTNTLTANSHNSCGVFDVSAAVTMNGIGEGAVLNLIGGDNADNSVQGSRFDSLVVRGGTVHITGGSGTNSSGVETESLTVEAGAVLNVSGGNASSFGSVAISAETITVNGILNASFGTNQVFGAGILCTELIVGEGGAVHGIVVKGVDPALITEKLDISVCGNAVLTTDLDLDTYAELAEEYGLIVTTTFTVPAGASLTVNSGVTLDLSGLAADDISFTGAVTNKGLIRLPADFSLDHAPKSGTVTIGEQSYTYDSKNHRWISAEDVCVPATGDKADTMLWFGMLCVSSLGLGCLLAERKRRTSGR